MYTDTHYTLHTQAHGHTARMSYTGTCIPHTHHTHAHGHTPHTHSQHMCTSSFPRPGRKWPRPRGGGWRVFRNTLTGVTHSLEEAWSRADEAEQSSWTNGRTAGEHLTCTDSDSWGGVSLPGESPLCRGRGWTRHTGAFTPMGTRVTHRGESGAQEHGGEGEWGSQGLWRGRKEGVER